MTDVFETILFFFFVWWVLQVLSRLITPVTANHKKNYSGFHPFQQTQNGYKQKEGETSIQYKQKSSNKNHNADNGADYVDYEEVK